ncbi:MAG: hypothetical protein KDC39_05015 [Actinobacteria bacterium]|nr:hypothetical protein [Actinomycetota bacterium]
MGDKRTRDQLDSADLERVEDARGSVKVLSTLAYLAAILGIGSLIVTVVAWVLGSISFEQALAAAFSTSFFTILTAGTTYGAKSNLAINASRLERQVLDSRGEIEDDGERPQP